MEKKGKENLKKDESVPTLMKPEALKVDFCTNRNVKDINSVVRKIILACFEIELYAYFLKEHVYSASRMLKYEAC